MPKKRKPPTTTRSDRPDSSHRKTATASTITAQGTVLPFPTVGLGASAGGLEALTEFFSQLPTDTGMAFVIVTHQQRGHASHLPELLSRHTSIAVEEAQEGSVVEPNRVYVAPPGAYLAILGGTLSLMQPENRTPLHLPIDHFFRSLAQDQQGQAVGIVLSGTGTDGTLGIKEIKGAGGLVMAQAEESARHTGMPHSAMATSVVDYVLPAVDLPAQLVAYMRHLPGAQAWEHSDEAMRQVFILLRNRTGHDFSSYKETTIRRRVERRMNVHRIGPAREYVRYLENNPVEVDALFKELLIGVTSFFRDPEAFDALAKILPGYLADRPDDSLIRVWVPGCSTGEEAYTLAILLHETMMAMGKHWRFQIFATDLDSESIDIARAGLYPDGIAFDVSPTRLERFFVREDACYRVRKDIREMLVFAPQNLAQDPPFTKLDILSCRNLLIYLDGNLQKRILPLFHYALNPTGLMLLGSSESIGSFSGLFETLDKKWRIFARKVSAAGSLVTGFPVAVTSGPTVPRTFARIRQRSDIGTTQLAERFLLQHLVPPTVLAQESGDIVHIHGRTGLFLEPAPGAQRTNNIFTMAREGLKLDLLTAFREASALARAVLHRGRVNVNGSEIEVDVRVQQIAEPEALRGLFLVAFERTVLVENALDEKDVDPSHKKANPIDVLERELQYTKETHQSTVGELEAANEELLSTNEELQSANEELQSANEELETSKEEMQSLNEELQTVNSELEGKVEELSRANDDMKNLLNSTDIATIFLDKDLNIKRFTEQAKSVISLIGSDIGRPLADLVSKVRYAQLVDDAKDVLRTLIFKEVEVPGDGETWYLLRILPYLTTENMIDGLVMTFVDISRAKGLQESESRLQTALHHSPTTVFGQDLDLRITWTSNSQVLGFEPEQALGKTDEDLIPHAQAEKLATFKRRALETGSPQRGIVQLELHGGPVTLDLFVDAVRGTSNNITGVTSVCTDITERVSSTSSTS